ncbi:MAG: aconitate hydratase AcnA [Chlorobi bacterium]|nr:aconitate hydratase AcnA [Chlorobiota bacterium]
MAYEKVIKEGQFAGKTLRYASLSEAEKSLNVNLRKLPYSIRVLAENLLRNYDGETVTDDHIQQVLSWEPRGKRQDIPFFPGRVLMQDFTGVPAVVDLASMRDALAEKGKDPSIVNPVIPADLVIDHSVQIDYFGSIDAYKLNVEWEYKRNRERYQFLKWAQQAFKNMRIVPPGMGIVHQVNLEYLATVVIERDGWAFPDTLLGMDSHTPMVNGIGVVGWGVGGIEAEAAMLGQPVYFLTPDVIGLKLTGKLKEGVTTTDLVLTITHLLRQYGVVGKFVEVFGDGLDHLTVPDRATISNMSPEFGCTITYFPIDEQTLAYLRLTGRPEELIELVEKYAKENHLWRDETNEVQYTDVIELDLSTVEPTLAGPRRPHEKVLLKDIKKRVFDLFKNSYNVSEPKKVKITLGNEEVEIGDGSLVLAAITSCTNTSNPFVLIGAGLVAKKAVEKGLQVKPWVKTSFAPGSRVVREYLEKAGLMPFLEALRFHIVGYGCTTCIGNSGPLPEPVATAIKENDLTVASVLSGNRNFEGRISPLIKMNFLASPPLVVAYALTGRIDIDPYNEPLAYDPNGRPVYLKDIWFSPEEVFAIMKEVINSEEFRKNYERIFEGDEFWQGLEAPTGQLYQWDEKSTYVKRAPWYDVPDEPVPPTDIEGSRVLVKAPDNITTDHISPAGPIPPDSPAGKYLLERGVKKHELNTYGARRGNHEVMVRGTFANPRMRNLLVDREGWWTKHFPSGEIMTVYDASIRYKQENVPLIVLGAKNYGMGSSRDWAAKGPQLQGIKAVIAENFERIHRSNLVGMGIIPLEFMDGQSYESLGLSGEEEYFIYGPASKLEPFATWEVTAKKPDGSEVKFNVRVRLESPVEVKYIKQGGILPYIYRQFLNS